MKKFLTLALALSMVCSLAACGGNGSGTSSDGSASSGFSSEEITPVVWKIEAAYGPGDQCWDVQMPMLKALIEKVTEGRVVVELYEPDTLCSAADIPASVANGTIQGAISSPNYNCQFVSAAYCETVPPFFFNTKEETYDCFYEAGLNDFLREEYYKAGLIYGGYAPCGSQSLVTTFKGETVEDLTGHIAPATSSNNDFYVACGASTVTMSGSDIYMALKLGSIAGTQYSLPELVTMGFCEVVKYCIPCVMAGSPQDFIFNIDAWEALPEDIQQNLYTALQEFFWDLYAASEKAEETVYDDASEYGVEFVELTDEAKAGFISKGNQVLGDMQAKYPDISDGFQLILDWANSK